MSWERDQRMFDRSDGFSDGYVDGSDSAIRSINLRLGSVLNVDPLVISQLQSPKISDRFFSLSRVADAVTKSFDAEQQRKDKYESSDPSVVAEIIINEQTDVYKSMDPVDGFVSYNSALYEFIIDGDGLVNVISPTFGQPPKMVNIDADWISTRLSYLGIERDEQFSNVITDNIVQQLYQPAEVTNG